MKWFGRQMSRQNSGREDERKGRKSIEIQQQIRRRKKKKAEIISCLKSSAWFILRLRNCAVDFMIFTALRQKRNAWQGYIWKHPAPWVLLESAVKRNAQPCTCSRWSGLMFSGGVIPIATGATLYRWQSLKFGSLFFRHVTKMSGFNALKSLHLQAWVCNVYYCWQGLSLKEKSWLVTFTRWAEGVNSLIISFLCSVKSRAKL